MCSNYAVISASFGDRSFVRFNVGQRKQRAGFSWDLWKLNAKLLADNELIAIVQCKLENTRNVSGDEICTEWELLKLQVKTETTERASRIERGERRVENDL